VLALLAAMQLMVESGTLHVDPSLDAKLPCKANAALEQAIRARLPRARVTSRGALGPNDLLVRIVGSGHGYVFEVQRRDGAVAMSRDLSSSCEQLGELSGLILERYLAGISWTGSEAGLVAPPPPVPVKPAPREPLPPPPLQQAPAPEPADAGTAAEIGETVSRPPPVEPEVADLIARIGTTHDNDAGVVETPPPAELPHAAPAPAPAPTPPPQPTPAPALSEPIFSSVSVTAGGGVWNGSTFEWAFSLDVAVVLRERFRVAVLGLISLPHTTPIAGRGSISSFDLGTFASLGVCTRGTLSLCGSAVGGERFIFGSAAPLQSGLPLYHLSGGAIAVPALGLDAHLVYVLARHFIVALEVLADAPLKRGALSVQGVPEDDVATPVIDVAATLQVGVRF
jgi:hypothetical protein